MTFPGDMDHDNRCLSERAVADGLLHKAATNKGDAALHLHRKRAGIYIMTAEDTPAGSTQFLCNRRFASLPAAPVLLRIPRFPPLSLAGGFSRQRLVRFQWDVVCDINPASSHPILQKSLVSFAGVDFLHGLVGTFGVKPS